LVNYTGRRVYPGKRGVTKESEPKALDKLGLNSEHWAHRIQGLGFEKALEIKQCTLLGWALARNLAKSELTTSGFFLPRTAAGCVAQAL